MLTDMPLETRTIGIAQIRCENPNQSEVVSLIAASDEYLAALYPAESNHLVDVKSLAGAEVTSSSRGWLERLWGVARYFAGEPSTSKSSACSSLLQPEELVWDDKFLRPWNRPPRNEDSKSFGLRRAFANRRHCACIDRLVLLRSGRSASTRLTV